MKVKTADNNVIVRMPNTFDYIMYFFLLFFFFNFDILLLLLIKLFECRILSISINAECLINTCKASDDYSTAIISVVIGSKGKQK